MTPITIDNAPRSTIADDHVAVWTQTVRIPTYPTGEPTPHPLYISNRVYQGSSGRVYPLPVIESVGDNPTPLDYQAVFLENRFLKVMVLPQIGGRIHMAYDKVRDYHFVYFNRVIKPALVGLVGPWISGGIEFNWPQHHRPSTFDPVEFHVDPSSEEEATVVLGEIDRMYGLRIVTRISLRREDARIHIRSHVSNRTHLPQTFLWWANPAVSVNDEYQATFPPDVRAVFDHGKRDVSRFPIATGTYYKVDYSHGVDISYYRNIPVPTSYMAHYSRHDFIGGYDHRRRAGLLHVAANRYSPGKKQWSWGTSHFGQLWEQQLTDEDGPYVELMTGIYTDNQPDFTWIMPGETKEFVQWFFPYADMANVRAANERAVLTIEETEEGTYLVVYVPTAARLTPTVSGEGTSATLETADVSPESTHRWHLSPGIQDGLSVTLTDADGTVVLSYSPHRDGDVQLPESATAPPDPIDVPTTEQLYLIGIHLEQNRHASWDPDEYFAEALRRDQYDARVNVAVARRWIYRNRPRRAREHAQRAVDRLCRWNANPESGWAHYYLGLASSLLDDTETATSVLEKASWAGDARPSALFELAALAVRTEDYRGAIRLLDECLQEHPTFERAATLRQIALRKSGDASRARECRADILSSDPLAYVPAIEERFLSTRDSDWAYVWNTVLGGNTYRFIDVLCEYAYVHCASEVETLCKAYREAPFGNTSPLPFYIAAHCATDAPRTEQWLRLAESTSPQMAFPTRLEVLRALESAAAHASACPNAHFLLGTADYDRGNYDDANRHWRTAAEQITDNATLYRNLALSAYNQESRPDVALQYFEQAVRLAPEDARLLLELDELFKRLRRTPAQRHELLSNRSAVVNHRDDLIVRYAGVLTSTDRPRDAAALFAQRQFHPWEGGEGAVTGAYRRALVQAALQEFAKGEVESAVGSLIAAKEYPANLGEGRLPNTADNEIDFWIGVALTQHGKTDAAREAFQRATAGDSTPSLSMYYNDVPARAILYQGLAWRRIGREQDARRCFHRLCDHADGHEYDAVRPDYFAVSLPDLVAFDYDQTDGNRLFCKTVRGLGLIGLGEGSAAQNELTAVLANDPNNEDAVDHLRLFGREPLLHEILR